MNPIHCRACGERFLSTTDPDPEKCITCGSDELSLMMRDGWLDLKQCNAKCRELVEALIMGELEEWIRDNIMPNEWGEVLVNGQ